MDVHNYTEFMGLHVHVYIKGKEENHTLEPKIGGQDSECVGPFAPDFTCDSTILWTWYISYTRISPTDLDLLQDEVHVISGLPVIQHLHHIFLSQHLHDGHLPQYQVLSTEHLGLVDNSQQVLLPRQLLLALLHCGKVALAQCHTNVVLLSPVFVAEEGVRRLTMREALQSQLCLTLHHPLGSTAMKESV